MHLLPRQRHVGDALVSLFTLGVLQVDLAAWLPAAVPPAAFADDFAGPILMPIVCAHIALPDFALVVDCCNPVIIPHTSYAPTDHEQPPAILDQMMALGIDPAAIQHVVITHSHFDHICGLVLPAESGDRLTFPNAMHYLGRADWNQIKGNLANPETLESRTLGLIERQGLLELIDAPRALGDAVRIIPAPGETPGHQIVRLNSGGETLYCLGDLYHHQVEMALPNQSVHWADGEANVQSRAALAEAALAERALLTAAHIAGFGDAQRALEGVGWTAADGSGDNTGRE